MLIKYLLVKYEMKIIQQKRKITPVITAHPYMMNDIRDTNFMIKEKLREANSFYDLMKFTSDNFLRGSRMNKYDEFIISPKIGQIYSDIQNVMKYCTLKSRSLFNLYLIQYTNALANRESLMDLRRKIIPLFKICFKESIDTICKKFAFLGN